ncbi:MAG TPA: PepSY-associated TM helix domain-containing protein, partial [Candidatus Binatia bacterium]
WPRRWRWRALKSSLLFNRRLRGKARNWNWHNVIGFWSSSVLIILTLTAAVMSYPWANDLLYTLTGSEPPPRPQAPAVSSQPGAPSQPARGRDRRQHGAGEKVEDARNPRAGFDLFFARAQQQVPDWIMMIMRFPSRGDGPVTISIQEPDAPHPFARSQLTLNRTTADVIKWEPYSENIPGRKLRTWVRALHTGEAFGVAGQFIAGLATLGGCFLVWTGSSMAFCRFRSLATRGRVPTAEESVIS